MSPQNSPKILLIDSNVFFAKRLTDAMKQEGMEVTHSTQAAYALTMLEWDAPSAILCATNLREMNAFDLPRIVHGDTKTASIPIVVGMIGDPVASGVVGSVARPGSNITGSSFFSPELFAKRLELLKEAMPQLTRVATLLNPENPVYGLIGHGAIAAGRPREQMARNLGLHLQQFEVRATNELEGAFENMQRQGAQAVSVVDIYGE